MARYWLNKIAEDYYTQNINQSTRNNFQVIGKQGILVLAQKRSRNLKLKEKHKTSISEVNHSLHSLCLCTW